MIHEIIPGSSPELFNELETNKLRKSIVTTSKLKGFKRSFDIYHDMNIPRACHILGIRERQYKAEDSDFLQSSFRRKLAEGAVIFGEKSKKWTYNALPSNATERKNMKSIRFEMVLVHEAFQYLLRRKAMQQQALRKVEEEYAKYSKMLSTRNLSPKPEAKLRLKLPLLKSNQNNSVTEKMTIAILCDTIGNNLRIN